MASPAPPAAPARRRRVGIVGCGSLGKYLIHAITTDATVAAALEIAFVWNRSAERVAELGEAAVPLAARCADLATFPDFRADVIVEVCHPDVTAQWGAAFLQHADFYCGSATALADPAVEAALRAAAGTPGVPGRHGMYIPSGALWGAADLCKMADRGSLGALEVCMKKHPASLKLEGALGQAVAAMLAARPPAGTTAAGAHPDCWPSGEVVLYDGPVRALCPLAPNNVNTMATAAIAAHTLGFDGVRARLVADASLEAHVITVEAVGKAGSSSGGRPFRAFTERYNPAPPGAITGSATYASFLSSLLAAGGRGSGVHLC
jgi:aspartate dehydrogenase